MGSRIASLAKQILGGVLGVGAMGLLMAWLAGAFTDKIAAGPAAPRAVALPADAAVFQVAEVRVPIHREAVGAVAAEHEVAMASLLLGRVAEVAATAGQAVEAGRVLVRLEDAEHQARLAQARAALAKAADTLARVEGLHARGTASDEEVAKARLEVDGARARVTEADTYLGYTVLRAPSAGVVIDRFCEVGDAVHPGQVLVRLFDRLQFVARVPESLSERLVVGQPVEVHIDALGQGCMGQVAAIVPRAETAARAFQVKVTGPCKGGVIPGMFGRLRVPMGEATEMRIPASAVRRLGQVTWVFRVTGEGTLLRRFVRLGSSQGAELVVTSGLAAGDRILADQALVRDPEGAP